MIPYIIFLILLIPFAFTPSFVFIFNAFFLIRIKRITIKKLSNFEILFLLYVIYTAFSIPFSADIARSLNLTIFNLLFIISYIAIIDYFKSISLERFYDLLYKALKYYAYISFGYFILGVVIYYIFKGTLNEANNLFGLHIDGNRPRFNGLGTSPSSYGLVATLFLLMSVKQKDKWNILLVSTSLLLTISWTVFLSVFVSMLVYQYTNNIKAMLKYLFLVLGIAFGLYLIFNSNVLIVEIIKYRIDNLSTGTHRFQIWEAVLNEIKQNLFFGVGYNYSPVYLKNLMGENSLSSLHNVFVQILFEQGIFGFFLFVIFFSSLIRRVYIQSKNISKFNFVFPWVIAFFIQMNAGIIIYSPNFLLLLILIKKLEMNKNLKS